MGFTHLHVHSNFSFLDGGSSVQQLLDRAKILGFDSLAITDTNGLYGAVRFYCYAKQIGIKPIVGVEIYLESGCHLVLLARNLEGYSNLCRLITRAQLSHEKGCAAASLDLIREYSSDLFCLSGCAKGEVSTLVSTGDLDSATEAARRYLDIFGTDYFLIELQNVMLPDTALLNSRLHELAQNLGLRCVATNNVHFAEKEDFCVHDLLACVRTITTLDDHHPERKRNAEYYLKSQAAMRNLFSRYPDAISAAGWVADQCNLDLGLGNYRFPDFSLPEGETAYSYLCGMCFDALKRLYRPIPPNVVKRLEHELAVINDLGFPAYFLVVWDIVREARARGIRCSGRGSAADSLVAYCLGITIADPIEHNLLFERFLNPERKGMPDIDIDFDAARRDEIIDYIYKRYGEDRVAMVCTVSTLQARSAIRDLGKAMGFATADIGELASSLPHTSANRIREAIGKLPELKNRNLPVKRLESLLDICERVDDFPRHLSVHLGGVVIGGRPLTDMVPLEWATKGVIVTQFDKDDIETLGLVKMDVLGLRNLSAIEDALETLRTQGIDLDIDSIPLDDEPTYELLRSRKTVGCFQVESPGMRGLLGRLAPEVFNDLIAQISLFRPGPMQADMIRPFIARRHGEEEVTYAHPTLQPILSETYGVILYQEQVISVSNVLAGFSYGQADSLRRAMTKNRTQEEMEKIREEFVRCAYERGVEQTVAEEVFSKLRAFAAYGFCKAHAASFGKIAYQTAYLKAHHPAEFFAGILNNTPMGFYPANVIVEEARRLGIRLLGVDVNASGEKFNVNYDEDGVAGIRIALSQVKDISATEIQSIISARATRPFSSFGDFCRRAGCDRRTAENLISCGAFDAFEIPRTGLLWLLQDALSQKPERTKRNDEDQISLLNSEEPVDDAQLLDGLPVVPDPNLHEKVRLDYEILGLSTRCHPISFYRKKLTRCRICAAADVDDLPDKTIVRVAGVVVVCMRPPTRSGTLVVFITLEDETGFADCVVFPKIYEKYGKVIYGNPALIIEGTVEKMGTGQSIIARRVYPLSDAYRTDTAETAKPFKERIRAAGARSFVRSGGV